jgi:Tetratricopeptide repeat
MINLAVSLWRRGRETEAEAIQEQVLDYRQKRCTEKDPRLSTDTVNLAILKFGNGGLEESTRLEEEVLLAIVDISRSECLNVHDALKNLATAKQATKYKGGEGQSVSLRRRFLEILRRQ